MPRKRYTREQIIVHLREAEVELAKGQTTAEVCRKLGITEQTYYRWRKEYGSLRVDQVRRLKDLGRENARWMLQRRPDGRITPLSDKCSN